MSRLTGLPSGDFSLQEATGVVGIDSSGHGVFDYSDENMPEVKSQSLELIAEVLKPRLIAKIVHSSLGLWFLHGEAVKTSGGLVLLIVGPSISGKTYLARALVEAGCEPWSTGYAVLNGEGRCLPFPYAARPDDSGGLEIHAIISSVYEHRSIGRLEPLSAGQAVLKLTSALFAPPERYSNAVSVLGRVSAGARYRYGGRHTTCEEIIESITRSRLGLLCSQ